MSFFGLLLRNLFYHWRGNVAVLLGMILGSAVLTGALLVGDSLRGSLLDLTLNQLAWVEEALLPGRFFRAALVNDIAADKRSAVLLLQGSVTREDDGETRRAGKASVLGVDASFWPKDQMPADTEFWTSDSREAVLNQALADALGAHVDDTVTLQLERADSAPRETMLAPRKAEDVIEGIRVKVRSIVPNEGIGRFSLKPSPLPALNAFVPIHLLQKRLDMAGRANAILLAGAKDNDLQKKLTLDDWGLRYRSPKDRADAFVKYLNGADASDRPLKEARWKGRVPDALVKVAAEHGNVLTKEQMIAFYENQRDYYALESQRMILEPMVVRAVEKLVPDYAKITDVTPRWRLKPILVYLADTITIDKRESPYAIIAGDDTVINLAGKLQPLIAPDEIMLMDWPGTPFTKLKAGVQLKIRYFVNDEKNELLPKTIKLKLHPLMEKIEGARDDPDLTPEFRGVTDKLDMANWENPPFPYNPKRIKKVDEDYWKRYKTTPKAYVNLKTAQELWGTRFGNLTSIQVRPGTEHPDFFAKHLLAELNPEQGGFTLQPIRKQAIDASDGSTDFGMYFMGFSFFLIVSALLLVGLLVRLNIDRRAREIGVLLATGWTFRRVRWLLLSESALLAVVGTSLGLMGALVYAHAMLRLLAENWPGGAGLNFLHVHTTPVSFAFGFGLSLLVSLFTLWWAMRYVSKLTPRALLQGETTQTVGVANDKLGWSRWLIPSGILGALALALTARAWPGHEAQAGSFLGGGALLLTACLAAVWNGLKISNRTSSPQPDLTRLGLRNAGRHLVRSVLTVGLLASASFLIVAVEAFHKDTGHQFLSKEGGAGGFAFYAEGSVPVFEDLTIITVRSAHGLDTPELRPASFYQFRVQAGDDTSCLNLYKPLKPRVMGVSEAFINRGGFAFARSEAKTPGEIINPWLLLERKDGDEIPAFIDANTAEYILKVEMGQTVAITNGEGKKVNLRIVGLLRDSIFQSEVLISEKNFRALFPRQTGFSFFLIDTGKAEPKDLPIIHKQLAKGLDDFGLDVQTTASRLRGYLAVENMYLATFQALGGLGLILGAVGLAIVLLRGVWERRGELALLLALGFRGKQLAWLVLAENMLLLALGLAAGAVSALLSVAPHLVGVGANVLWLRIVGLLALVLIVGGVAAVLAVVSTLRTPVLTALRRE